MITKIPRNFISTLSKTKTDITVQYVLKCLNYEKTDETIARQYTLKIASSIPVNFVELS